MSLTGRRLLWPVLLAPAVVSAYPEGAPWGAAHRDAVESCHTCHFDSDALYEPESLVLDGLPTDPEPGEYYELVIRFVPDDAVVTGFQLLAVADESNSGLFSTAEESIECLGGAARSTDPAGPHVEWRLAWQAPDELDSQITFHLAATGGNDDGSPLGDRVSYRTYVVDP